MAFLIGIVGIFASSFNNSKIYFMPTINPYLNFPGTTEEAFNFYKSVFGGEFAAFQRFSDTPEGDKVPPAVVNKKLKDCSMAYQREAKCISPYKKCFGELCMVTVQIGLE